MKMLKNGLEVDGFATSRIPIPSPPSTKRVDVLRCAARPPARPAHDPHAEDGAVAVAVAEPVDEEAVLRKQKKRYKKQWSPFHRPKMCGECRHAMAPRRKRKRSTTRRPAKRRRRVSQVGGVAASLPIGIFKAGYGITKAIGEHQQKRAKKISDKRWRDYLSGKRKSYGGESFNCSLM